MSDDIELPVIHKFTTSTGDYQQIAGYVNITKDIARQIVALVLPEDMARMCADLDVAKINARLDRIETYCRTAADEGQPDERCREILAQMPTHVDAGGEDAAVEAIRLAMGTKAWDSYVDYAKNVVQLIRAGKVPNIVDATVLSDERGLLAGQYAEIAALRVQNDELEAKLTAYHEAIRPYNLMCFDYACTYSLHSELGYTVIESVVKDATRLRAEIAEAHKALPNNIPFENGTLAGRIGFVLARDEANARAEVAALREVLEGYRNTVDDQSAELVALKSRLSRAEETLHVSGFNDKGGALWNYPTCWDDMKADLAALRARKVNVGRIKCPYEMSETVRQCAYHRGVEDCADAIRAAGIEVE